MTESWSAGHRISDPPERVQMSCALTLGLIRELVEATAHMPDSAPIDIEMRGSVPVSISAGRVR